MSEIVYQIVYNRLQELNQEANERKRKWKRRLITVGAVLLTLLITAGVTLALQNTLMGTLDNEFKFGQTKVTVIENDNYDWNTKEVRLKADAGEDYVPGVVRAMIVPYVLDGSGNYILADLDAMPEAVTGNTVILGDFMLELDADWSTNWFYKDGFFYYRKVLSPGETTGLLLKKVSLTDDTAAMQEKYADAGIRVEVMAGILQAEGGAPETEWGVTVNGSTVSP